MKCLKGLSDFLNSEKKTLLHMQDDNGATHRVYYPSPRSLEQRLEMFQKAGLSISIWELGQGLECFMDLL